MREAITTSIVLITLGSLVFAGEQVARSSGGSMPWDKVAIGISLASFAFAIYSWLISRRVAASSQLEAWIVKVYGVIKDCLPSNDIPHEAGLPLVRLLDSIPKELQAKRKDIAKHGYFRAVPGGGFDAFWVHLCEIQEWNNGTST